MANKNRKKNTLPTVVELFQGTRSVLALSAIQHTGGGFHTDKRDRKDRKDGWKREVWD